MSGPIYTIAIESQITQPQELLTLKIFSNILSNPRIKDFFENEVMIN